MGGEDGELDQDLTTLNRRRFIGSRAICSREEKQKKKTKKNKTRSKDSVHGKES